MLLGLRPWAWSTVAVVHVLSPHRPQRQRQQEQEQIDNKNKNKTTKNNNKKQKNTLTSLPMVIHALGFVSLDIVAVVHVLPPHVLPDAGRLVVEVGDALLQLLVAGEKLKIKSGLKPAVNQQQYVMKTRAQKSES